MLMVIQHWKLTKCSILLKDTNYTHPHSNKALTERSTHIFEQMLSFTPVSELQVVRETTYLVSRQPQGPMD